MNLNTECKYILVDIQLKEESNLNEFGFEGKYIFNRDFLTPTAMFLQLIPLMT